jgi:hypothetical protein
LLTRYGLLARQSEIRVESRLMDAKYVRNLVERQIDGAWDTTNHHGVDLRKALVSPQRITVIERLVRRGATRDRLVEVWLVLVEAPASGTGYRIVVALDGRMFGLASEGFPSDEHLVLCGWYGDFMTAFRGM